MIYSINQRQGVTPEQAEAVASGDTLEFTDVPVPYDGNPGPCVIFVVTYTGTEELESATVNGFPADAFTDFFSVGALKVALIAAKISSSRYSVSVALSDPVNPSEEEPNGTIVGYAFGNCDSIFFQKHGNGEIDTPPFSGTFETSGPGTVDLGSVMFFSTGFLDFWTGEADNTITVSSDPGMEFTYADGIRFVNGTAYTSAYALGNPAELNLVIWAFDNLEPTRSVFNVATAILGITSLPDVDPFNCECEEISNNETLGALRRRLLVRLGYSAQADSPPPGMTDLLDDFLRSAQRFLYGKFPGLRTERFFSWTMVPGQRFYDLFDNDETCSKELNPYKVTWAGVEDLNGAWYQITKGIPPEFYTMVNFLGIPSRYEIRQCIEVLPAPAAAYKLRIKGHFGLTTFTADADKTTIDSELVFLWALGNAKNHYGEADAKDIAAQADTYLKGLIGGSHQTARYIPGTHEAPAMTPPIFLPLQP